MRPERIGLPIVTNRDSWRADRGRGPEEHPGVHVTSLRISGGFAWMLVVPLLLIGATLLAFGAVAAGILGLLAVPWLGRRRFARPSASRDAHDPTIELDHEAYRRVDGDERS